MNKRFVDTRIKAWKQVQSHILRGVETKAHAAASKSPTVKKLAKAADKAQHDHTVAHQQAYKSARDHELANMLFKTQQALNETADRLLFDLHTTVSESEWRTLMHRLKLLGVK